MATLREHTTLRPFHETIIDAIHRCSGPSTGEIIHLLRLIEETIIPEGHDTIIAAIDAYDDYFDFKGYEKWAWDIREAKENLLARKQTAEAS